MTLDAVLTVNVGAETSWWLSSDIFGPVTGHGGDGIWYLYQVRPTERRRENGGRFHTDESGAYQLTVPLFCGEQLLKLAWSNEMGRSGLVFALTTQDCQAGDIRITLSWGSGANDLELHLIRAGGRINVLPDDNTWTNMNPDWGAPGETQDNPRKDVDHTGANGLENIFLSNPEEIGYHVMVEYWGSGAPTTAQLVIIVDNRTYERQLSNFQSHYVWDAATIDWPNRRVLWNTTEAIDCANNWSSGCQMDIPTTDP